MASEVERTGEDPRRGWELSYWKVRRSLEGAKPQGYGAERLSETGKIRIRNERFSDSEVLCQVLDLIADGTVDVILVSRT